MCCENRIIILPVLPRSGDRIKHHFFIGGLLPVLLCWYTKWETNAENDSWTCHLHKQWKLFNKKRLKTSFLVLSFLVTALVLSFCCCCLLISFQHMSGTFGKTDWWFCQPKYFVLKNVPDIQLKAKKFITSTLGIEQKTAELQFWPEHET